MDFDLTREDPDEPRRSSVLQLRRTRTTPAPIIDDGDDWDTRNAASLAIPSQKPLAPPAIDERPSDRTDAFNLEPPADTSPVPAPVEGTHQAESNSASTESRPSPISLPRNRRLGNPLSALSAFPSALLSTGRVLLVRAWARKRVLAAICVTSVLVLGVTEIYGALSANGPDTTSSRHVTKASALITRRSTTADHSTTSNSAFITNRASRAHRDTHRAAQRTRRLATHHHTKAATQKRRTTPRSTTRSIAQTHQTYTARPAVVAPTPAPAASESTSTTTKPATQSSGSTNPPTYGEGGVLGAGHIG
jgi:hypothetical protein